MEIPPSPASEAASWAAPWGTPSAPRWNSSRVAVIAAKAAIQFPSKAASNSPRHPREGGDPISPQGHDPIPLLHDPYLRWLHTQGVPLRRADRDRLLGTNRGWLLEQKELFSQRAPGNTWISALLHGGEGELEARNTSKGCGAVMRVAPVALYATTGWHGPDRDARAFQLAMELGAITHGHPTSKMACGVLATLLVGILRGEPIAVALDRAVAVLRGHEAGGETERAIERARELANARTSPWELQLTDSKV